MEIISKIDEYLSKDFCDPDFFQLYSFTTENVDGYMNLFDLKDKSLLTVGSSFDQGINASLARCYDITVCDICPLTKYFSYLKLASLLVLNREDFLNYLCKKQSDTEYNRHSLSKSTFKRIKDTLKMLDYESYCIWEYLFGNYAKKDIEKLFRTDINALESVVYCNRYLKNDYNYNLARKFIMNASISFVSEDIIKFSTDRTFHNIWLSNVPHVLNSQGIDDMFKNCSKILDNDGKMLLCYFWNTGMTIKGFHIEQLEKIDSKKIIVPGILEDESENSILVYTKK